MYYNFVNYIKAINNIYDKTHEDTTNELETTNSLLYTSFFLILFSYLAFVLSILPFYSYLQTQREDILKLFCTYPED